MACFLIAKHDLQWVGNNGFSGNPAGKKKNPPAMQETLVWFLGREDPLEKR